MARTGASRSPGGQQLALGCVLVRPAASGRARVEDRMGADPPPDHVRNSRALLGSVLPGGAPVRGPGHLIYPRRALDAPDPKPRAEPARIRVRDELSQHHLPEPL